jgi:mono/diheme cytochrome c family protein
VRPVLLHGTLSGSQASGLAWVALLAGLLLAGYGLRAGLRRPEGRSFFLAGLAAAAVVGVALAQARFGVSASLPRNPVPASFESVAAGRRVYEAHCAACHGLQGAGDGPASPSLPRKPADLRVHVPMHPDGLLYRWISEGVPDRSMPAFRGRLTEEERWHVVNYLRVLALSSR